MIAQATHTYDSSQDFQLAKLLELVKQNNILDSLTQLKQLVPEYQPIDVNDFKVEDCEHHSKNSTPIN